MSNKRKLYNEEELKIINWINWPNEAKLKYVFCDNPEDKHYTYLKKYLLDNNLIISPEKHQNDYGVPLFNDNTVIMMSLRAWSTLLAEVFGGYYLDYYLD